MLSGNLAVTDQQKDKEKDKEKALHILKHNISKFIAYQYKGHEEWLYFKTKFSYTDQLTTDEKMSCLISFFQAGSVNRARCIELFTGEIANCSSVDNLLSFISQWFPAIDRLPIGKHEKEIDQNNLKMSELTQTLIEKLIELKLSTQDILKFLTYKDKEISIPALFIISFTSKYYKGLWHLLRLLIENLKEDSTSAAQIYVLLTTKTSESKKTIGHRAVHNNKTMELYFNLLSQLEKAGITQNQLCTLLKLQDNELDTVIEPAVRHLFALDIGQLVNHNQSIVIQYFKLMIESDDVVEFLGQRNRADETVMSRIVTENKIVGMVPSLTLKMVERLGTIISDSPEKGKDVAAILLSSNCKNVTVLTNLLRYIPECEAPVATEMKQISIKITNHLYGMLLVFLEQGIESKVILDELVPVGRYDDASTWVAYNNLCHSIKNIDTKFEVLFSIIEHLFNVGLDSAELLKVVTKQMITYIHSEDRMQRTTQFFVWLNQKDILTAEIATFLSNKNGCSSTKKTKLIHKKLYAIGFNRSTYCDTALQLHPQSAGRILYPLAKAGMIPAAEYNDALRDAIFNFICQLPQPQKLTDFAEIKNSQTPLAKLFWISHDIWFIHRERTLDPKYAEVIDVEFASYPTAPMPSIQAQEKTSSTPEKKSESIASFARQFPSVPKQPVTQKNEPKKVIKEMH